MTPPEQPPGAAREASPGVAQEPDQRARGVLAGILAALREIVIVVGLAMVVSLLVKTFLVQPFHIPSGSMENTLVVDDRVLVSKLHPRLIDLQRGDIVVFSDPDGWLGEIPPVERSPMRSLLVFLGLAPDDSREHLIKRIVGLPGDRVACCDVQGKLTVNGVAVTEPYLKPGDTPNGGREPFDVVVPEGKLWVMGDHRSDSADSRFHDDGTGVTGSVPIDVVKGRAVLVVWPLERVSWLSAPERVFASVPAPGPTATPSGTPTGTATGPPPTPPPSPARTP